MQPGTRLLFNTCDKTIITILNFKISWGGGGGRRNCGWGGNSSPPPPAWNPGTCQKLEQVACAPPTSSTVSYDPHSHSPTLPHSHPPTLTPSQSRGPQLNVIPLALRWYSSSGGSTRITSNFDPREDPKVTVEVHRLRSSSLNRLVLQREIRRSLLHKSQNINS